MDRFMKSVIKYISDQKKRAHRLMQKARLNRNRIPKGNNER